VTEILIAPARPNDRTEVTEDRTREQLYDEAKKRNTPGRSRMGKWDLVEALRKSR
jgi:hypothetical protein